MTFARRLLGACAPAAIALLLLLGAGTAYAHSSLISSDPAAGAQIATGPDRVTLTFNEALQTTFSSLTVVGPDGNLWSKGDPSVDGPRVSVAVGDLGPVGEYTVAYRVTSADSHPVSGTLAFTLTAQGNGTPGGKPGESDGESDGLPVYPFILAAVAVFGAGLFVALRRPKRQ